jgi:spermidine synthase
MVLDGHRHWRVPQVATGMLAGVLMMFALGLAYNEVTYAERDFTVHQVRNFYGTMTVNRISDGNESGREFVHGATEHGIQYDSPELSREPTSYYARHSGVGVALQALNNERDNLRVGAVGLGIGTIAAYGRPGDYYHFFEINPAVRTIARSEFTYLRNCKAETKITLGDARISMENLPTNSFDVLILDAFSGDAIPAHLLTLEAFDIYERLLEENGVIAVHVTNTSLNLIPVVAASAEHLNMEMVYIHAEEGETLDASSSNWLLVTHDESLLNKFDSVLDMRNVAQPLDGDARR